MVHWDVNNEYEHSKWFEEKLEDPFIMDWMFREINKRDKNSLLFLNEYQILNNGTYLQVFRLILSNIKFAEFHFSLSHLKGLVIINLPNVILL